jgi:Amt family ammonium transporter
MDTGSSAFILICSAMVCLMTPALAFFYGGLGRRKNVINTMMMSVLPLAIASLLWVIAGYSLSFGGHGRFFGNFSHLFLNGVSEAASSRGLTIPDMLFAAFQMMFSIICVAILTGSVVGRMRFTPLAIFVVFWLLLVYYPFAHMVWDEGLLAKWGTIDFAGGDVVHITSGVSALVLAIVVGKRRDFGILEHRPHNVPFVLLGAGLLWFGWFGFNAGSALAANGLAVHALVTTHVSAAAAMFSWLAIEKHVTGHPSLVGGSTGLVAGLVAITPGAGFVSIWSAILIGLMVSPICFYAISVLKKRFAYDDALDAFGCHGVGGIFGGLATAIFTTPDLALDKANIGLIYGKAHLFIVTILAISLQLFGLLL